MSDWSDEVEARLRKVLDESAEVVNILPDRTTQWDISADIRAALGEIEHFHTIHKWCHREPTHGKCCTCQACGLDYDSCRCDLDEQVERAEAAEAKLAEAREELEAVLRDWNDLVAATGSRTNGGAVGHARQLLSTLDAADDLARFVRQRHQREWPAALIQWDKARAALRGKHKEGCCCTGCALRGGGE